MRIERRLPFGFKGDWGKLYKRYDFQEDVRIQNELITHEGHNYVDIGEDVQFKRADDASADIKQEIKGAMEGASHIIVKTTDAYWDNGKNEFECIAQLADVVFVFGKKWVVKSIVAKTKYAPSPLKVFYLGLENTDRSDKNE